jgi:hypothetical protein
VASTALAEGFAVIFEAGFIYFVRRKTLSPRHTVAMSLVMNAASFLLPLFFAMVGFPWMGY